MKNITPPPDDNSGKRPPEIPIEVPKSAVEEATTEALEQISAITDAEDDRRKTADAKLSAAQSAIGFIITIAGGSVALAFLQAPVYDFWHGLVIVGLTVSVAFFVFAACNIVAANDPVPYQGRVAESVRQLLDEGKTREQLQRDAINDFVRNLAVNTETTNDRMGLYRAAIRQIRTGVITAGIVPVIVLIGYALNALVGTNLPPLFRIAVATCPTPSVPTSASTTPPTQPPAHNRPSSTAGATPHASATP